MAGGVRLPAFSSSVVPLAGGNPAAGCHGRLPVGRRRRDGLPEPTTFVMPTKTTTTARRTSVSPRLARCWSPTERRSSALFAHVPPNGGFNVVTALSGTDVSVAAATATTTSVVFDPVLPDASTIVGMVAILVLSILAVQVWATQVVPVSRTNLALDKKRGPLRTYLDDLLLEEETKDVDIDVAADKVRGRLDANNDVDAQMDVFKASKLDSSSPAGLDTARTTEARKSRSRAFERWLFSDWLSQLRQRRQRKNRDDDTDKPTATPTEATSTPIRGRQKSPAIPVLLPTAKWNSGDNPVLVASALIGLGVVATSIVENLSRLWR